MEFIITETLGIVKAQASLRIMSTDEIVAMIMDVHRNIAALMHVNPSDDIIPRGTVEQHTHESETLVPVMDPRKSIGLRKVTCLVCGREMKVMTKKHLATHGMTPESYKEHFGLPRNTSLVCKALSDSRSNVMGRSRIWEKRMKKFNE